MEQERVAYNRVAPDGIRFESTNIVIAARANGVSGPQARVAKDIHPDPSRSGR